MTSESDKHVEVDPYDPRWPSIFESEKSALLALFGDSLQGIEHIGSTAICGLAAKPIIDLMVGARELKVDEAVLLPLRNLGYEHFGEYGIPGRHFFRKGDPRTHHLHWVQWGGDFWEKQVLFRDYMRAFPKDAEAYERLKKRLAELYRDDRTKYTQSKTEFVEAVLSKARRWRT
ncbi:MAG TPA: GrpB family protein [Elusimicrobia bacterium]|nr:GrpB family protein [Elusimicrobiota bacterium]